MYRADELSALFHGLHHAHHRQVRKAQMRLGLENLGSPMLLMVLMDWESAHKEGSQRELAKRLRLSPATVATSLKTLERDGYVERQVDERDARRNQIHLTDKGRETVALCAQVFRSVDEQLVQGFSQEEKEQLVGFMRRMVDNLGGLPPPPPGAPEDCPRRRKDPKKERERQW